MTKLEAIKNFMASLVFRVAGIKRRTWRTLSGEERVYYIVRDYAYVGGLMQEIDRLKKAGGD